MDLAIQIINYNTLKYLRVCLESVISDLGQSSVSYRVLILDNNSNDSKIIKKDLANYISENIEIYTSRSNIGFSRGHNELAEKAKSDYILILNPDIKIVQKNTISNLLNQLKDLDNSFVAIGPALVNNYGVQRFDHGEIKGVIARLFDYFGLVLWKKRATPEYVAWVSGAFLLINRKSFELVGGFDPNFFLYREEEDLCRRLREKGYKILYNPNIKVHHKGSVVAKKSEYFENSDRYYTKKHFSKKSKIRYYIIRFLHGLFFKITPKSWL